MIPNLNITKYIHIYIYILNIDLNIFQICGLGYKTCIGYKFIFLYFELFLYSWFQGVVEIIYGCPC